MTNVILFSIGAITIFILFFYVFSKRKGVKSTASKDVEKNDAKKENQNKDDWGSYAPEDESFEG